MKFQISTSWLDAYSLNVDKIFEENESEIALFELAGLDRRREARKLRRSKAAKKGWKTRKARLKAL